MHPNWGPDPQPRHVPWPGIQLAIFGFVGWDHTQPRHTRQRSSQLLLFFYCLSFYSCSHISLCPFLLQPHTFPNPGQSPHYCGYPWIVHKCSLVNLFTIFHLVPHSHSFLAAVSLLFASKLLLLSFSLVYCVHEIMWYFSFMDWLNSLSIIFSRSIHTVPKSKSFFFIFSFFTAA